MSEKRFILETVEIIDCDTDEKRIATVIFDREKTYSYENIDEEVCDLLNEQQATINKLEQENADLLGARIKAQEDWEKCTDKLKAKILEQQATITELQQDLEDSNDANATLEVEIIKLRKQIQEGT